MKAGAGAGADRSGAGRQFRRRRRGRRSARSSPTPARRPTQIKASQAELAAAEARAADAERALKRARELRAGRADCPIRAWTRAQAPPTPRPRRCAAPRRPSAGSNRARTAAERRVAQGRAEVSRARDQLDKTDITAPIDGIITRLDVEQGEMVVIGVQNQPGTILMTVSDLSVDQRRGQGRRGRRAAAVDGQRRHRHPRGPAGADVSGEGRGDWRQRAPANRHSGGRAGVQGEGPARRRTCRRCVRASRATPKSSSPSARMS